MATVSKALADNLVASDGYYKDDPRVMRIVEYTSGITGTLAYGIEYSFELGRYYESVYVRNPRVYWEAA